MRHWLSFFPRACSVTLNVLPLCACMQRAVVTSGITRYFQNAKLLMPDCEAALQKHVNNLVRTSPMQWLECAFCRQAFLQRVLCVL